MIRPIHHSIKPGYVRTPNGMEQVQLSSEAKEELTKIAIQIWEDCINKACTFQDALLAVYLSGIENGASAAKEIEL